MSNVRFHPLIHDRVHAWREKDEIGFDDLQAAYDILDRACSVEIEDDVTEAMESIWLAITSLREPKEPHYDDAKD